MNKYKIDKNHYVIGLTNEKGMPVGELNIGIMAFAVSSALSKYIFIYTVLRNALNKLYLNRQLPFLLSMNTEQENLQ
jgi:hypothetical protein